MGHRSLSSLMSPAIKGEKKFLPLCLFIQYASITGRTSPTCTVIFIQGGKQLERGIKPVTHQLQDDYTNRSSTAAPPATAKQSLESALSVC